MALFIFSGYEMRREKGVSISTGVLSEENTPGNREGEIFHDRPMSYFSISNDFSRREVRRDRRQAGIIYGSD